MTMKSIRMQPVMKEMVWGGRLLNDRFGKDIPSDKTGESWEIAAHENGQSRAKGGIFDGQTLGELVKRYKEELVGTVVYDRFGDHFPLLVKFIDANQNLSVQVHPNDEQAVRLEGKGASGKTEMWYVRDAQPGARLVYGLNRYFRKEELLQVIHENRIEQYLNWVPVYPGDTFFIPAGTLHAIGSGILIAEIQQNSDLTYRVYDYGRLGLDGKPRPLHVEKSVDVIHREVAMGHEKADIDTGVCCSFFETIRRRFDARDGASTITVSKERFEILICVQGTGMIDHEACREGDSFLIPATAGDITVSGDMVLLQTHVIL